MHCSAQSSGNYGCVPEVAWQPERSLEIDKHGKCILWKMSYQLIMIFFCHGGEEKSAFGMSIILMIRTKSKPPNFTDLIIVFFPHLCEKWFVFHSSCQWKRHFVWKPLKGTRSDIWLGNPKRKVLNIILVTGNGFRSEKNHFRVSSFHWVEWPIAWIYRFGFASFCFVIDYLDLYSCRKQHKKGFWPLLSREWELG